MQVFLALICSAAETFPQDVLLKPRENYRPITARFRKTFLIANRQNTKRNGRTRRMDLASFASSTGWQKHMAAPQTKGP
jgi:hypothetical protein